MAVQRLEVPFLRSMAIRRSLWWGRFPPRRFVASARARRAGRHPALTSSSRNRIGVRNNNQHRPTRDLFAAEEATRRLPGAIPAVVTARLRAMAAVPTTALIEDDGGLHAARQRCLDKLVRERLHS